MTTPTPESAKARTDVTREGITVVPGQIWEDLDKRMSRKRQVVVVQVDNGVAHCRVGRGGRTRLLIRRMHKGSTGWKLISP